ncbi:hypothetical protein [Spiroplasma taiwanense]|uniref:Transmembrane protein n=1 Tax=Spiroplasma taiwanense CT-1 TaxID=1276220 RepID=S5LXF8_9MOLU|nr:hypothetical protein [Spiroplasma taiwanense]AGR41296.1 hypothetical protein STAIW_v1c06780 [Spiroplasma taiwanense CT-1]
MEKNKTEFEGLFKVGVIITVVLSSLSLGFFLLYALIIILLGIKQGIEFVIATIIVILFLGSFMIGTLVTLILFVKALKNKSTNLKVALGVLGILFSGLIGGILILCAPAELNSGPQMEINKQMDEPVLSE